MRAESSPSASPCQRRSSSTGEDGSGDAGERIELGNYGVGRGSGIGARLQGVEAFTRDAGDAPIAIRRRIGERAQRVGAVNAHGSEFARLGQLGVHRQAHQHAFVGDLRDREAPDFCVAGAAGDARTNRIGQAALAISVVTAG